MALQISSAAPIILETETTTLRLDVADDKVSATYFGAKVGNAADLATPEAAALFYPSHWDAQTGSHGMAITQRDGQLALDPGYVSHAISEPAAGSRLLRLELKDRRYPVALTVCVLAHRASNVFERWVEVTNKGEKPIVLNKAASASLHLKADKYFLTSFPGTWGTETMTREQEIGQGANVAMRSGSTPKGAADGGPTFLLSLDKPADETTGEVILGTLAWSGNWAFQFENNATSNELDITIGYDNAYAAYTLDAGKTFTTPRAILSHSRNGAGEASRNLHRWARGGGLRGGDQLRDILLNSWEGAYFTFDESVLHGMMDGCKQMGVELFVLDDGWFGNTHPRDNDKAGLGDWQVNAKKLPNGIHGLVNSAKERGLKFGIWVEPEMVNPKSDLYEKHPDWVIALKDHPRREGRNQLVLDLTRPEVRDFIYDLMDKLLTENPDICYIKWDCNYTIVDPGSGALAADRQQNLQVDYINGYYAVLDRLTMAHPQVVFQACGSGGGRADYGAMKFHHEFWTSDNTDPYDRVFIQWGASYVFPAIAMAAHVTESPNHYSQRVTPLKFRFDVAMSGRLGLELSPKRLTPDELAYANKAVAEYKRIRPVVQFGELYRLKNPYKGDLAALQYVREENGARHSVFFSYLKEHRLISGYGPIPLQGLDPAKRYKITEINRDGEKNKRAKNPDASLVAEDGKVLGGDFLMTRGLTIRWNWRALQSVAVEITEAP
ncbi:MAG: alpha-galactosidase [Verrucomicrobiota bacterium]